MIFVHNINYMESFVKAVFIMAANGRGGENP